MGNSRYPVCRDPVVADAVARLDDAQREAFEERAGIIEFEAGLSRIEAERRALADVLRQFGLSRVETGRQDRE